MCMKGPASEDDGPVIVEELETDIAKNVITSNRCSNQPSTIYMNRTGQCVPLCHSNNGYTKDDREAASTALFIMSLLCTALTSVCLLTFCTRKHCLVGLPELSLLFCSVSFSVSAIVYLFSLLYRDQLFFCTISEQPVVYGGLYYVAPGINILKGINKIRYSIFYMYNY
ncbi:hypothetical protein LOAG_15348 [Loa loa]|uniref:Frizzled/Smoothened 7TM domain-containing protein n=1 Tax=Loa loa TaxID=7209 RepID=A0A1S0TG31_LOALO|nr:hypothetical protein LOAG_15348 [Loa loa]EFO13182.2 hypothetical protein LOAG_15348 [Loa loa]